MLSIVVIVGFVVVCKKNRSVKYFLYYAALFFCFVSCLFLIFAVVVVVEKT